jgi:hypothetical protein
MSCEKKLWSQTKDTNAKKKFCLVVRMVEDGALEAVEDVNLNNGAYVKISFLCMVGGDDVIGGNGVAPSSILHLIRQ